MQRILIRHLSGQRSNQIDSFPADLSEDLIAGRDPLAGIHFDPEQDDLVSRQHVKITTDPENPTAFRLIDLQSRNGTFVNQRRVYGSTFLNHNDRIQLGPSGPEFRFELDPPPLNDARGIVPTLSTELVPNTREVLPYSSTRDLAVGPSRPLGRATVERMLDETFGLLRQQSNKAFVVGLICVAAVLAVGFLTWSYLRRVSSEQQTAHVETTAGIEKVLQASEQQSAASRQTSTEIAAMANQIKRQEAERDAQLNSLSKSVNSIKKTQAKDIADRRAREASQGGTGQDGGRSGAPMAFGQLLDRVNTLVKQNKYAEALGLSQEMIQQNPERYEGYFYAGVSALEQQHVKQANDYLKQAETKAPAESRPGIERLLVTAQRLNAREK
jgi:pSer/pThr/pTyr-binding forkhead associated (FHA) protein